MPAKAGIHDFLPNPMTALELLSAYRNKKISPVETITRSLAAIERDRDFNAWVHIAHESALQQARASESRWRSKNPIGPLDGIPIGVKDLLAVTGQPMRRGSPAYPAQNTPAEDSPIVARFREAGAIIIGKTATPDAGCKLDTSSLIHGTTRNPHNPALTPGGSSGGSAAALALGHVPIAIGTDGAGSIRVPAAFCGVYGLKPSTGRIPAPVGPFWPHAVTGPMTRTVLDTALALITAAKPDSRDPYALPYTNTDWLTETQRGVKNLRIALAESFNGITASTEATEALHRAAATLESHGAIITRAEPAWPCNPLDPFLVFWHCMYAQSVALMLPAQAELIDPVIKSIIAGAEQITRAQFQTAMTQRDALATAMAQFHESYDLLLCPIMPGPPWQAGRATPEPYGEENWSWCPFAYPFNLTRQPAASVPMGLDANNLPLAVQLVAANGRDELLLRASFALESA
jgi:aspartyl-tRNA(Asn)/glutamyl-tRNA(Gln) amidotransferase subunit A